MPTEARRAHEKRSGIVAPPEPDLTPKELVARADSMRATLRERQALCEQSGRLPPETNDDFVKAGFYRTLQPRCFGGCEFDLPTFVKVIMAISRGCTESALGAGPGIRDLVPRSGPRSRGVGDHWCDLGRSPRGPRLGAHSRSSRLYEFLAIE